MPRDVSPRLPVNDSPPLLNTGEVAVAQSHEILQSVREASSIMTFPL